MAAEKKAAPVVQPAKPTKPDPMGILPGDYITLHVPPRRFLVAGEYQCTVLALMSQGPRHETYRISYEDHPVFKDRTILITIYQLRDIIPHLELECFINGDEYPVSYIHTPNLEARLKLSVELLQRRQKR